MIQLPIEEAMIGSRAYIKRISSAYIELTERIPITLRRRSGHVGYIAIFLDARLGAVGPCELTAIENLGYVLWTYFDRYSMLFGQHKGVSEKIRRCDVLKEYLKRKAATINPDFNGDDVMIDQPVKDCLKKGRKLNARRS